MFLDKTGFNLSEISLKQQFYLAEFFKKIYNRDLFEVFSFFKIYQSYGSKVFLSLEHGGSDMGQKILDIGAKLPLETASKIFAKYAEIIDSIENVLSVAQNNFKSSIDTKPELLESIEQSLYKRGADLLSQFHDNLNQNPEEILAELERINADTITTLSIFKYAAKFGNKLPLEDITGSEFSKKTGNELSVEDINEMEHIYQSNWKNYGNQELIQSVIQKFRESLTGDQSQQEQIYTFKKNDQINAFVKFSQLNPGVKYASALNVDQSSKGFGLGETMMDEALYREAQENILIATCDPYNDSNMRYFEKGFIGTGFTGDNPPVMNICWNESMNNHIQSKHVSVDDLVMMYLKKQAPSNLSIKKGKTLQEIHTDIPAGKSLTRCFKDPLHTGDWYAVYEPIPMDYETNIKTTQ
jgi:predicted GNAT family acetyltransferase